MSVRNEDNKINFGQNYSHSKINKCDENLYILTLAMDVYRDGNVNIKNKKLLLLYKVARTELILNRRLKIPDFPNLNNKQRHILEYMYKHNTFADSLSLKHISTKLRLSPKLIKRWFIYKRLEEKRLNGRKEFLERR